MVKILTICGFIQTEFTADLMGEFLERMTPWVRDASLQRKEDLVDGLESAEGVPRHAGRQELRQAPPPGELSSLSGPPVLARPG